MFDMLQQCQPMGNHSLDCRRLVKIPHCSSILTFNLKKCLKHISRFFISQCFSIYLLIYWHQVISPNLQGFLFAIISRVGKERQVWNCMCCPYCVVTRLAWYQRCLNFSLRKTKIVQAAALKLHWKWILCKFSP